MRHRVLAFVAALVWAVSPSAAFAPPLEPGRLAGEVLEFRIRWGILTAGNAVLEVLAEKGQRLRFRATARTLPLLDKIYPVEDLVESSVQLPGLSVLRYFKRSREGWRAPREEEVLFDPQAGTSRHFRNGQPRRSLNVPEGVQDPLSSFYWYRAQPLSGTTPVALDVTDGNKLITGTVAVLGRETVETPAGTFQTVLVEPKLEGIGGVFKKSPGARVLIWLTDDQWRRPVKLQSKVVVGHFTAELTKVR